MNLLWQSARVRLCIALVRTRITTRQIKSRSRDRRRRTRVLWARLRSLHGRLTCVVRRTRGQRRGKQRTGGGGVFVRCFFAYSRGENTARLKKAVGF